MISNETPKAAAAFARYCTMEDRSLAKLCTLLGKKRGYVTQLARWSKEYDWQERVRDYDVERIRKEDEAKRKKREQERERMDERHAQIGVTQQLKALEQIALLMKSNSFNALATVQLLKYATDLERVARGTATEQIAITGDPLSVDNSTNIKIDARTLTAEQLDRLEAVLSEVEEAHDIDSEDD